MNTFGPMRFGDIILVALVALVALTNAGCSGYSKQFFLEDRQSGISDLLVEPIQERDVREAMVERPTLDVPVRLAIYEIAYREDERPDSNVHTDAIVDICDDDAQNFESVALVTPLLLSGSAQLLRLRHAAARSQSNVLLVAEVDSRVETTASGLVALNLLLFGLLLPSETVEVDVRIQGHLVHTETGFFLGTFIGRGRAEDFVSTPRTGSAATDLTEVAAADAYRELHGRLAAALPELGHP